MHAEAAVVAAGPVTDTPRRAPHRWLVLLLAGYLLQVAWRVYLSWPITGPIAHADEDGYMLGARVLAGGPDATLPSWSIMRPIGYPLVLTPAYWLAEQPVHVYQIVHVINAVLMAATFPLSYLFARRLFGLSRVVAAGLAFVLATLPSMVFFSEFALTDALLPTLVMALLLLVHGMFGTSAAVASTAGASVGDASTDRPSAASGRQVLWCAVGAGAVGAYAASTHVRGLVMLVVVTAVVALGTWRRWLAFRATIAYAASVVVIFGAGSLANSWLEGKLFATHAYSPNGRVLDRLTSIKTIGRTICDGSGQVWHLCTSTYGLAALGLAAAVWALYRREGPLSTRIVLGSALTITVGIALATAAGTPTEGRVNNHVYGRYVAMFAAFWALVGIVALLRSGWRRSAGLVAGGSAVTLLSLGAVLAYAGRKLPHESYVNFDAPELSFLSNDWTSLHIYQMTLYAIGFMVIFAATLAAPSPRWLTVGVLAATVALNVVAMVSITDHISRTWSDEQYNTTVPELVRDAGVQPGDSIAEANSLGWWVNLRHQHEVYWRSVPRFDDTSAPPDGPTFVVAESGKPTDWDGTRYGYHLVLRHDEGPYGIWAVWRHN